MVSGYGMEDLGRRRHRESQRDTGRERDFCFVLRERGEAERREGLVLINFSLK